MQLLPALLLLNKPSPHCECSCRTPCAGAVNGTPHNGCLPLLTAMLYPGFQVSHPEAGPCTGTFCPRAALSSCLVSRQPRRQARYHGRGDVAKRSEFEARKRAVAEAREARLHKDDPKVASGGRGFPDNPLLQARPVREPCLCSR